jgi:hypothetical protein
VSVRAAMVSSRASLLSAYRAVSRGNLSDINVTTAERKNTAQSHSPAAA